MKKGMDPEDVAPAPPLDAPWFEAPLARVIEAKTRGNLGQSLLIHSHPGAGGTAFTRRIAQALLCERDGERACGECRGCTRVAAGQHPDLVEVRPLEESKQIRIDQVREVIEGLSMTSYEGRGTVVTFDPADSLNEHAANALLKNLEEPRRDAWLLLVATQPSLLPATIRSRCLHLRLDAPAFDDAIAWLQARHPSQAWAAALQVLGVAPYDALRFDPAVLEALRDDTWRTLQDLPRGTVDVVRTAEAWGRGGEFLQRLACLENCLTGQALRRGARGAKSSEMRLAAHLSGPELDINIGTTLALLDHLKEIRQQAASPLNKGLALERFLWRLSKAAARQA
jgi:DNA polymerase III subunit delta'